MQLYIIIIIILYLFHKGHHTLGNTCCSTCCSKMLLNVCYNVAMMQHVGNMLQGIEHCSIFHMLLGSQRICMALLLLPRQHTLPKFIVGDYLTNDNCYYYCTSSKKLAFCHLGSKVITCWQHVAGNRALSIFHMLLGTSKDLYGFTTVT